MNSKDGRFRVSGVTMVLALASIFHIPSCKSDGGGDADGNESSDDFATASGSRLKLSWLSFEGEQLSYSLFDTELEVPCSFSYVGPDDLRCVPQNADLVWFADADCTEPVMQAASSECATGPRYGVVSGWSSCEDNIWQTSVYEPTDVSVSPETLHTLSGGDCIPADQDLGEMVEAVPTASDTFVGAERKVETRTSTLGVEWYAAEDGTMVELGIVDLAEDRNCSPVSVGAPFEGDWYCVGNVAYSDGQGHYGYVDDECTSLAAATYSQCGEPDAVYLYDRSDEGCIQTSLHEVGDPIDEFYAMTGEMCAVGEDHPQNQARRFEIGDTLEGAPEVERVLVGEGRIQVEYYAAGSTELQRTGTIYDADLETSCSLQPLPNGKQVCLPYGVTTVSEGMFADADCTQPVVSWSESSGCPGQTSLSYVIATEQEACGSVLSGLWELGDAVDTVYSAFGEECLESEVGDGTIWYAVGDELDPEEALATLEIVEDE